MSLFPISETHAAKREQGNPQLNDDPAAWLSNNASFRPQDALSSEAPYGKYATQADFLRAAERYLETSSDEDAQDTADRPGIPQPAAATSGRVAGSDGDGKAVPEGAAPAGPSREVQRATPQSDDDAAARGRRDSSRRDKRRKDKSSKRKRRRDASSSRSRSPSRVKHKSQKRAGGGRRDKKRKRRRHSSSTESSEGSSGRSPSDSDSSDGAAAAAARERAKILRLERAATAAGLAPRQAAAALASSQPLSSLLRPGRGAAGQPGDIFYDTRGDMDNLVYECLYGANVVSYHRIDPFGLAKGARARRLLPGQVAYGTGAYGDLYDGEREASLAAARYFSGRAVAAERSRRLRRLFLAETPVLPGTTSYVSSSRYGPNNGSGSTTAASGAQHGWLMSELEPPPAATAAGGGRLSLPLPAFMPLVDPAVAAAAAAAGAAGADGGLRPAGMRETAAAAAAALAAMEGESSEEWVLRRTREFNVAVREAPEDVKLWLRFAAFQDTVARLLARRATEVAGAAAEKKLAILQRGLAAHPGHPLLLRAMMAASEPLMDPDTLMDRWEKLLRRYPGESSLWRDYLTRRRAAFAATKLPALQSAYGNAMHAMASERARLQSQLATSGSSASADVIGDRQQLQRRVADMDRDLVRLVLDLIELELSAGATEVAVARVQALVEFHCFAPGDLDHLAAAAGGGGGGTGGGGAGFGAGGGGAAPGLRLSAGALLRLFDNFWEGTAPRVGEEGAVGWANWYRREHESLWVAKSGPDAEPPPPPPETDPRDAGGWTGWIELPPPLPPPTTTTASGGAAAAREEAEAGFGAGRAAGGAEAGGAEAGKRDGEEGELDEEAGEEEEQEGEQLTDEELLAQLGLKLDEQLEEMQRQGVPPDILARWLRTEKDRSDRDWQPLRPPPLAASSSSSQQQPPDGDDNDDGGAAATPDPLRVVLMDEIRDCIFPIQDADLKRDLLLACLSMLGVPLEAPGASHGAGGNSIVIGCCCPLSYLRLLPQQATIAACRRQLPQAPTSSGSNDGRCWWGGAAGADEGPWFLAHESRRAFVARLLRTLLTSGPYVDELQLSLAYLLVEASAPRGDHTGSPPTGAAPPPPPPPPPSPPPLLPPLPHIDRARQAARGLLQYRRNSVALLVALAAIEDAAGHPRGARRVRDAALAGAVALPDQERRLLPLLVHQYVEAERLAAVVAAAALGDGSSGGVGAAAATAAADLEPLLRAHQVLRWFLTSSGGGCAGGVGVGGGAGEKPSYVPYKSGGTVTREEVAAARRGFEALIPELLGTKGGALDAPSASCLYLGGLFEALTGRLFPAAAAGLAAALTVFKHATAAVPAVVRQASGFHEALAVSYCGLVVSEMEMTVAVAAAASSSVGGSLQPARARIALLQALELYPHSPHLLALRVRLGRLAGAQCRLRLDLAGLAAGLRRRAEGSLEALAAEAEATGEQKRRRRQHEGEGGPVEVPDTVSAATAAGAVWWAQLASELRQQPPSYDRFSAAPDPRVGRLLERAATARHLAVAPPVWSVYLAHEAAAGRLGAAKRVFLRAVREVPLAKDLWMLGLRQLGCGPSDGAGSAPGVEGPAGTVTVTTGQGAAAAPPPPPLTSREVSELLGVAADKGVRLRTDVYEVMLEALAEQ